jgi:hypothetical protein
MDISDPSKMEQHRRKRTIGELYPGTNVTKPIYMTITDCSDNHDDTYDNDMHCDKHCMHDNEHEEALTKYQIEQEMYDYIAHMNDEENSDNSITGSTFSNPIMINKNYGVVYEDDSFHNSKLTDDETIFDDPHGEREEEKQLVSWCNEASLQLTEQCWNNTKQLR